MSSTEVTYPHVFLLTSEDESCNLRFLPLIPLQREEDIVQMAERRKKIIAIPSQRTTVHLYGRITHHDTTPEIQQRFNISPFEETSESLMKLRQQQEQQELCEDPGYYSDDVSPEVVCDEEGYELSTSSRERKRKKASAQPRHMSCASVLQSVSEQSDWNSRFQQAIENIFHLGLNTHTETKLHAYERLSDLASDFNDSAKKYAKIIISEVRLPDEAKTIKPVYSIPGLAGGKKYIIHKILFKFAVDVNGIYGGLIRDENAARVANHDLKSLIHVLDCWEPCVHLPLMTLVDYRGFRVVCMSLLPINLGTIVHGSSDAGKTVHYDEGVKRKLSMVANLLNLREHHVEGKPGKTFHTPIDLEAHVGTDGRLYLVDFGRFFPPQKTESRFTGKNKHLYQLFRPEFIAEYPKPLCSDACSAFIQSQKDGEQAVSKEAIEINKDIEEATKYLCETIIPNFASKITKIPPKLRDETSLTLKMHEVGINTRYLGFIYKELEDLGDENWLVRVFVEMVSRITKNKVRRRWRNAQFTRDLQCLSIDKRITSLFLNNLLGRSEEAELFWKKTMQPAIEKHYPQFKYCGTEPLLSRMIELGVKLGLPDVRFLILANVTSKLCIRLMPITWEELSRCPQGFERAQPFMPTDIVDMAAKTKEMNIANHASGFILKVRAKFAKTEEEHRKLLSSAVEQFSRALDGHPNNRVTLRSIAECYAALGRFEESRAVFDRAVQVAPNDTITWYKYAISLVKQGMFDEAEECFLKSLEACPMYSNCCYYYADFLAHCRKIFPDAEQFYNRALLIDPKNASAANNYAIFLTTVRHDLVKADELFRIATEHSNNPQNIANYAAFLYYIKHDSNAAQHLLRTQSPSTLRRTLGGYHLPLFSPCQREP